MFSLIFRRTTETTVRGARHSHKSLRCLEWTIPNPSSAANNAFSLDPSILKIFFFNRLNKGLSYGFSFTAAGKDFNPEMGFQQRENYLRFDNRLQCKFAPKNSNIFRHGFSSGGNAYWKKDDGVLESLFWRMGYQITWNNTWEIQPSVRIRVENLVNSFSLSDDVIIPEGRHAFNSFELDVQTTTLPIFAKLEIQSGQFYDGRIFSIDAKPSWAASSSLQFTMNYEYNKATFDKRNQVFNVHLLGLRTLYMFTTKLSLAAFLQYNSLDQNFGGNIRFRYNPSEGNDLYIVYNDEFNIRRDRFDPVLPISNERQILVKYSYTFRL